MENIAAELGLILGLIYLVECFRWVSRSAVLFRGLPLLGFRKEPPWTIGAQFRRTLGFGFPLPPFGSLYSVDGPGARLLPEGALFTREAPFWTLPPQGSVLVPWSSVSSLSLDGIALRGPSGAALLFSSRRAARSALAHVQSVGESSEGEPGRRRAIERALDASFDLTALEERLRRWSVVKLPLKGAASGLFLSLFGALALWAFAPALPWGRLLLSAAGWWGLTVGLCVVAVRRALPPELRPHPLQWVTLLVSPMSLMRSADFIESELLTDFDPLAVAARLLPKNEASRELSMALRALSHPLRPPEGLLQAQAAGDEWLRKQLSARVRQLAKARGLTLDTSAARRSQCPRCLTEYSREVRSCSSCLGVDLE